MYFLDQQDKIYFPKTKEYFEEVMSSYSNGNYRSAIVMLYSVVVCDLLFKLQEMSDMYNDKKATKILSDVNKIRTSKNVSKSKWEKELVDKIYKETELLNSEAYANINQLYTDRNFSAHPALNENYELITPTKEQTIAHIKDILECILIKPPLFISNVIDFLTDDIASKKDVFKNSPQDLENYLNRKYFERMPDTMKKQTFKAFWKFCFNSPDNEDCQENLVILRKTLEYLYDNISEPNVLEFIKKNPVCQTAAPDNRSAQNLCIFLSKKPKVYPLLNDYTKLLIDKQVDNNSTMKFISWFLSNNKEEHIEELSENEYYSNISKNAIIYAFNEYKSVGLKNPFLDYLIEYFGASYNFKEANKRYNSAIRPFLEEFNKDQFIRLIEVSNKNDQIYGRTASFFANTEIMEIAKNLLDKEFPLKDYENFEFDREKIYGNSKQEAKEKSKKENQDDDEDDDSIPF